MAADALTAFEPRKTPIQARATVTVEAISEATIQILLSQGAERLTTTRVADRAGVSVGTLYQYFPNKQSLLFAVLEDHLEKATEAVEDACEHARHQPLTEMIKEVGRRLSTRRLLAQIFRWPSTRSRRTSAG